MVLVGGLFATLTLPAYADNNAPTAQVLAAHSARVDAQSVSVDASVTTTADKRDSYGATSATDLRALYADAIRQQNMQAYLNSGAKALGDDYPWPDQLTVGQGGGLSPLHYFYRECVDFVAWRLNRDAGSTHAPFRWDWSSLTPSGGDASQWKYAWQAHGWATGATPKVGAVAWFPGGNHVAYVSGLLGDGSVLIEEYNGMGTHVYGQRIILASDAYYLYAPPA
jgi:surface antigen